MKILDLDNFIKETKTIKKNDDIPIGSVRYGDSLSDTEFTKSGKKKQKFTKLSNTRPHREIEYKPKKTLIGYKLFNFNPNTPGIVYPLYVNTEFDAKHENGLKCGKWYEAGEGELWVNENGLKKVDSKLGLLAYRPGWHLTDIPKADHIGPEIEGKKYRDAHQVFAECEIVCDDETWQLKADAVSKIASKKFLRELPKNGMYKFKTNTNADDSQEWYIADKMRINKILTDDEVDSIIDKYYGNDKHRGLRRYNNEKFTDDDKKRLGF